MPSRKHRMSRIFAGLELRVVALKERIKELEKAKAPAPDKQDGC